MTDAPFSSFKKEDATHAGGNSDTGGNHATPDLSVLQRGACYPVEIDLDSQTAVLLMRTADLTSSTWDLPEYGHLFRVRLSLHDDQHSLTDWVEAVRYVELPDRFYIENPRDIYTIFRIFLPEGWENWDPSLFDGVRRWNYDHEESAHCFDAWSGRPRDTFPVQIHIGSCTWTGRKTLINSNDTIPSFNAVQRLGTEREFEIEKQLYDRFHEGPHSKLRGWLIPSKSEDGPYRHCELIFEPRNEEKPFPQIGDVCDVHFKSQAEIIHPPRGRRKVKWNRFRRIDNSYPGFHHYPLFQSEHKIDLETGGSGVLLDGVNPVCKSSLSCTTPFRAQMEVPLSDTTMQMELGALNLSLQSNIASLNYLRAFKNPSQYVSVFRIFNHMRDPLSACNPLPQAVKDHVARLDEDQMRALETALDGIPDGVLTLHGGCGTGKTHLALAMMAVALCEDIPKRNIDGEYVESIRRKPRIMVLTPGNRGVNDLSNAMVELCKQLGLRDINILRPRNWNYELMFSPSSKVVRRIHEAGTRDGSRTDCKAFTLREAAEKWVKDNGNDSNGLFDLVNDPKASLDNLNGYYDAEWARVFQVVLKKAEVIFTTPVGAAKLARIAPGCFQPDLIFCDDASAFRPLATQIPLVHYKPLCWILLGDHRALKPFVQTTYGSRQNSNMYDKQLQTSMLERAYIMQEQRHELLVSHRARGGLTQLASELFFDGKLRSALPADDLTRGFLSMLGEIVSDRELAVPRLLLHVEGDYGAYKPRGSSSWQCPEHLSLGMMIVERIVLDQISTQPSLIGPTDKQPASVLVLTPYVSQVKEYKIAIRALYNRLDESRLKRQVEGSPRPAFVRTLVHVECRTVDTADSHQASFVIFDMVHHVVNNHIEDEHRLYTALTRSQHAEVIIMNRKMMARPTNGNVGLVRRMYDYHQRNQLLATVPKDFKFKLPLGDTQAPVTADAGSGSAQSQDQPVCGLVGKQRSAVLNKVLECGDCSMSLRVTRQISPPVSPGSHDHAVTAHLPLPPTPGGNTDAAATEDKDNRWWLSVPAILYNAEVRE